MFLLNEIKSAINNGLIVLFAVISYMLIFKISKTLKESGKTKDGKIAKTIGVFYALFTITALVLTSIY